MKDESQVSGTLCRHLLYLSHPRGVFSSITEAMGHEYELHQGYHLWKAVMLDEILFGSRMRIGSLSQFSFSPRDLVIETSKHLKESSNTLEGDPIAKR